MLHVKSQSFARKGNLPPTLTKHISLAMWKISLDHRILTQQHTPFSSSLVPSLEDDEAAGREHCWAFSWSFITIVIQENEEEPEECMNFHDHYYCYPGRWGGGAWGVHKFHDGVEPQAQYLRLLEEGPHVQLSRQNNPEQVFVIPNNNLDTHLALCFK